MFSPTYVLIIKNEIIPAEIREARQLLGLRQSQFEKLRHATHTL
jgi:hypothetical protein